MWPRVEIQVRTVDLAYSSFGEGRPLVFLHGGGVDARAYQELIRLLSRNFLVYAPDLPGFGGSGVPDGEWGFLDYGKFMAEWLEVMSLDNVVIVGHSFGGGVALAAAASSSRIRRVVVADAASIALSEPMGKILNRLFFDTSLQALKTYKRTEPLQDWLVGLSRSIQMHWKESGQVLKVVERCLREENPWLQEVSVPTLVLWGDNDVIFPVELGMRVHKAVPKSEFAVVEGDHGWCLFQPEVLVHKVLEFSS